MKNKRQFWIGFVISLLLHGMIIASFFFFLLQPNTQLKKEQPKSISLSLSTFKKDTIVPLETERKEAIPAQKIEATKRLLHPKKEKQIALKEIPRALPKETQTTTTHQEETSFEGKQHDTPEILIDNQHSVELEEVKNTFLTDIQAIIEKNKTYPKWARKMRIEGTVMLEFKISHNGTMLWCKVITSSGNTALDEHALLVLEKASTSFPKPLHAQVIKLPMVYQLVL